MSKKIVLLPWLLIVLLALMASSAFAEEQKVVAYLTKNVNLFAQQGQAFKRTAKVPVGEMPALPVEVLTVSPKGFVKIQMANGFVWLDSMDVDVLPPKSSGRSTKKHQVSASSKKKGFHTRGMGE